MGADSISNVLLFPTMGIAGTSGKIHGPAMRYLELARALARKGHETYLCDPTASQAYEMSGVHLIPRTRSAFAKLRGRLDVAIISPYLLFSPYSAHLVARECFRRIPLVVDLYNPVFAETIASVRGLSSPTGFSRNLERDLNALLWGLGIGDYFLCGNNYQRQFYAGLLFAIGRAGLANKMRSTFGVVPMGVSDDAPSDHGPLVRDGNIIRPGDFVFLFLPGQLFGWYDGVSPILAFKEVHQQFPRAHLVFCGAGGTHRQEERTEHLDSEKAAKATGLLGSSIHFIGWVEYSKRGSLYLQSDCGVVTSHAGLENMLSCRARIPDALWGGLPLIVTEGNEQADQIAGAGAGFCVKADDPQDIAEKMVCALSNPDQLRRMSSSARELALRFRWDVVVEPLHRFCSNPVFASGDDARIDASLSRRLLAARPWRIYRREFLRNAVGYLENSTLSSLLGFLRTSLYRTMTHRR